MNNPATIPAETLATTARIQAGLVARHRAERRFRAYGMGALAFAGVMLVLLLVSVVRPGILGFTRHEVRVDIPVAALPADGAALTPDAAYTLTTAALRSMVGEDAVTERKDRAALYRLAGFFASDDVRNAVAKRAAEVPPPVSGSIPVWMPMSDLADLTLKGTINRHLPANARQISDQQLGWLDAWQAEGRIRRSFNRDFFTHGDSRAPEAAGFAGSIMGTLLLLAVCMLAAMPIAVMAAITLEEFARKTRLAEWLEILINNLAAVPSIIYGLLGLTVFLQWMGLPRSSPLVGGLTLALLVLPVMIIAARAAIRAVPPSMRQAATALGATKLQVVRHHVLPYALPGIMTGTILSFCRAIGETAPLLMIGMVAFVADVPHRPTDAATAMPVQIYLWASSPELGYHEKTSAGILVLLVLLLILNAVAITVRKRSQLQWN